MLKHSKHTHKARPGSRRLANAGTRLRAVEGGVRSLRRDVEDLQTAISPLADHVAAHEELIHGLDERVGRIEKARGRKRVAGR